MQKSIAGIAVDTFELVKKLSSARIKVRTCLTSSTEMIERAREATSTSPVTGACYARQNIGSLSTFIAGGWAYSTV